MPKLKQGDFIDCRPGVMMCLLQGGFVPKHGQNLGLRWALGRLVATITSRNVELGSLAPFLCSETL